jgi:hypothetical protein
MRNSLPSLKVFLMLIAVFYAQVVCAQETNIKGTVVDNSGEPLPGVQPNPGSYPQYISKTSEIAYMNFTDFIEGTGKWTQIRRITPGITKYPRNHNAAISRDELGAVNGLNDLNFYYTVSKAAPEVNPSGSLHAEWTYYLERDNK